MTDYGIRDGDSARVEQNAEYCGYLGNDERAHRSEDLGIRSGTIRIYSEV